MVTQRALRLLFRTGTPAPDGNYGSSGRTYGEAGWTYGQSATEGTETRYELTAFPGWGARSNDWEYRQWDTSPDMEVALLAPGGVPIDYSLLVDAELVLTMSGYSGLTGEGTSRYSPTFPLTIETDRLRRVWEKHDLVAVGTYRVAAIVTYVSGRTLTVPASDEAALVVRDGARP
jgi:hypothetical protein